MVLYHVEVLDLPLHRVGDQESPYQVLPLLICIK